MKKALLLDILNEFQSLDIRILVEMNKIKSVVLFRMPGLRKARELVEDHINVIKAEMSQEPNPNVKVPTPKIVRSPFP